MSVTYIADYLRAKAEDEIVEDILEDDLRRAYYENTRIEKILDDLNRSLETGVFKDMGIPPKDQR